jgi:serine/threonine protein kinase
LNELRVALRASGRCSCHSKHHSKSRWLITDFGFSTINLNSDAFIVSKEGRGTPAYRAPELIRSDGMTYSQRSDSWSVGCILFKVATTNNRSAFLNDFGVTEFALDPKKKVPHLAAVDNIHLLQPTRCPVTGKTIPLWQQINDILDTCFTREPEQRAKVADLMTRFESMWLNLP